MARPRKKPTVKQRATVAHKEYLTFDPNKGKHTKEELAEIRKALAKRANQRLVRLERATSKITGEKIETFGAAEFAYQYLERKEQGKRRFNESMRKGESFDDLKYDILQLQSFLTAKTSTVQGVHEIEKLRFQKFEGGEWGTAYKRAKEKGITGEELEKYKQRSLHFLSTKEFYDFVSSATFKGLQKSGFTSEQLVEVYDEAREKSVNLGVEEDIYGKLVTALEEYREGKQVSLKDLKQRLKLSPPLGGNHNENRSGTKGRRRKRR